MRNFSNLTLSYLIPSIIYLVFMMQYINFIPIWDGYLYALKILNAGTQWTLNLSFTELMEIHTYYYHPTLAYSFIMALAQKFHPGLATIYWVNLLLALVSVYAYVKIVKYFVPKILPLELGLAALVYVFNPVFIAAAINPNADFPVLVFFVTTVYALIYKNKAALAISLVCLVFSKESGVILYLLTIAAIFFMYALYYYKNSICQGENVLQHLFSQGAGRLGDAVILFLPLLLLLGYLLFRSQVSDSVLYPGSNSNYGYLAQLFLFFSPAVALTRLTQVFVLNYTWVLTVFIICCYGRWWLSDAVADKLSLPTRRHYVVMALLSLVFLGFLIPHLIYNDYTNSRYMLPTVFFVCLFFQISIAALFTAAIKTRIAILVLTLAALVSQINYTTDPVSRYIFGVFSFGQHEMLKMVSLTGECCGLAGRDQLAYNAQFSNISSLTQKLLGHPEYSSAEVVFVVDHLANFNVLTNLHGGAGDSESLNLLQNIVDIRSLNSGGPPAENLYYVNMPWMNDSQRTLKSIADFYTWSEADTVSINGYPLDVYPLHVK